MASDDRAQDPSWLEHLHFELMGAASLLSVAPEAIESLDLNRDENIERIGNALAAVYEVTTDIYERSPDLKPSWVKPDWGKPGEAHRPDPEERIPEPPVVDDDNEISPAFDQLRDLLSGATQHLSSAAGWIRDTNLKSELNIRRVGETLWVIGEISADLYEQKPELIPLFLRDTKRWKHKFE